MNDIETAIREALRSKRSCAEIAQQFGETPRRVMAIARGPAVAAQPVKDAPADPPLMQRLPHPPFCSGPATGVDMISKAGAERCADMIRAAWRNAGHEVETVVEVAGRNKEGATTFTVKLPGLVNGLPRR